MGAVFGAAEIEWIRIENVVGTVSLNKSIDLETLYLTLPASFYEPEQFPGLIYKPLGNSITCLIFSTGKMVVVGGRSENQIKEATVLMQNILSKEEDVTG
ncbi:MAG: hypothetical protein ABSD42_07145 [Candidatus Bathyarchaeia archaeon]